MTSEYLFRARVSSAVVCIAVVCICYETKDGTAGPAFCSPGRGVYNKAGGRTLFPWPHQGREGFI